MENLITRIENAIYDVRSGEKSASLWVKLDIRNREVVEFSSSNIIVTRLDMLQIWELRVKSLQNRNIEVHGWLDFGWPISREEKSIFVYIKLSKSFVLLLLSEDGTHVKNFFYYFLPS
jgi:hypothetical protein